MARERLREQATHDALTGLWNRGTIMEIMRRELTRSIREQRHVGVIMCDLDHFKHINDTHGHLAGDAVLRQAAERLSTAVRSSDYVGRYGGEEFLIVLPDCSPAQVVELAERVRAAVGSPAVSWQGLAIPLTVSVGAVAQAAPGLVPGLEILPLADACLFAAKRGGRNRVVHRLN